MKKITLAITLISCFACQSQPNELTDDEFYNIKLNGVKLRAIYDTNGDENQMKSLFGTGLNYKFENDILISKDFWSPNNFYISFHSDDGDYYYLSRFNIRSASIPIEIKDVQYRIGDEVNFGFNIRTGEVLNETIKVVTFIDQSHLSCPLYIRFDPITNKIVGIEFDALF